MQDIFITDNNDLIFENGDAKIVDGVDRVIQHIKVALKILKGDWFLDYRAGIDYFNGMKAYPKIMKSEIRQAILDVDGVDELTEYDFYRVGNIFKVKASVIIDNNQYNISEEYSL